MLVGPSGCGKSTLLNTIAGLETITAGEIRIDGRAINDLHPSKRDIAMVFQSYALYPNMTVAENIAFGMEMRGVPKAEREKAVAEVAKTLQIEPSAEAQARASFRAASASASPWAGRWCASPQRLPVRRAAVQPRRQAARRHAHRDQAPAPATGTTIVYVTHDQIEAMTLATKIAVLKDGELQQVGTPAEIYNSPANLFVADFMGSPAMNLLEGKVSRSNGAASVVDRTRRNEPIRLPVPASADVAALSGGRKVIFGIRPEAITRPRRRATAIRRASRPSTSQVEIVEPAGSDTFVVTSIAGKEVTARMRADADVRVGQSHAVRLQPRQGRLVRPGDDARL